jgi:hypothetical protein
VFGNQGEPDVSTPQTQQVNTTIAQLKALYDGKPLHIDNDLVIGGKIISSDASGNIYRSLYIQDETGAIEVKIGNSGLYNDYKPGQMLYVKCQGLVIGNYGGMLQIGADDPTGEYETAYIDVKSLISSHIFKGEAGSPVTPQVVSEDELKSAIKLGYKSPYFGKLVTLNNLTYAKEIFVLIYLNSNLDKKASSNRLFLSDQQWGVDTWAFSANKMKEYLLSGVWNSAKIGNSGDYNYGTVEDAFKVLYEKIKRHKEHILNTIRLGMSNARIEATNNKIKLIIRKAYGFRNIQNMLDMVYLVCSDLRVPLPNRKPKAVKSA